jgi:S-formylglutathione hydrolase FrmB
VIGETWIDDRTVDVQIRTPSSEQTTERIRLLLPSGWSRTASRTWPVLYLLHGGLDDHRSWTRGTSVEQLSASRPVIVAMPDSSWCSAYSDWWNHGSGGRPQWETYVVTEVRQILVRGYRAGTRRAIAGNSMGGLGAMKLAASRPDLFRAAAAFSGDVDPMHMYDGAFDPGDVSTPGLGCAADWTRVWGDPRVPAQRAIWERNSPWHQAANLRGLSLYLSSGGNGDLVEAQTTRETRGLATRLQGLGIPATTHFFTAGHDWQNWDGELTRAWPQLMSALGV